jgi:organic hydroperoxide reductase OsmC/OhrA
VIRPRRDYRVDLARDGTLSTDRGRTLDAPPAWTPEHLVLAALARCMLLALEYHAKRESVSAGLTASASGHVNRREDGSWGFVELTCALEVTLDPEPPPPELAGLIARTEEGCFVGASLVPKPTYHWRVNGVDIA